MRRKHGRAVFAVMGVMLVGCTSTPEQAAKLEKLGATLESMSTDPQTAQMGAWRLNQIRLKEVCQKAQAGSPQAAACSQPAPLPVVPQHESEETPRQITHCYPEPGLNSAHCF